MHKTKNSEKLKPSKEKSMELAMAIDCLKPWIHMVDLPYLRVAVKAMFADASRVDSTAPLNRNYDPAKTELMRMQATALGTLGDFIEQLIEIDKKKVKISDNDRTMDQLAQLFS